MKTKIFVTVLFFLVFNSKGSAQNQLWILTNQGGVNNVGAILSLDPVGMVVNLYHSFQAPDGFHPYGKLVQADDGKLYGTCYDGGFFGSCTIFSFDPTMNTYTDVHDFDIIHGDFPKSGLVKGSNGLLYGVTTTGGSNGTGVLYSWNTITGTYTVLKNFGGSGNYPHGTPVIHSNGKIYGMAKSGGMYAIGMIYSYDINSSTYADVYSFDGMNGSFPNGNLIEATDGKLYGLTPNGGATGNGVLFNYDPLSNSFSKLYDFNVNDGLSPMGSLMQSANGMLYGMADSGGIFNCGTLFKFDINTSVYTKIHDFVPIQGIEPIGDLFEMGNDIYGATNQGGIFSYGTIFSYSLISNSLSKLFDFDGINGANPAGGLIAFLPTGLVSNQNVELKFYPNPVAETLTIFENTVLLNDAKIEVSDLTGKHILSSTTNSANNYKIELNVSNLSTGIYILSITLGDKLRKFKFVKN